jgi:hypothetical protein
MFATGVPSRDVTGLYFVPKTSKLDRLFFIDKILKAFVGKDIPRLYQGDARKIIFDFNSATLHTTPAVYQYLDNHNMNYIRKEEWMTNSPDQSPMHYGPNGIFEDSMFWKKPRHSSG